MTEPLAEFARARIFEPLGMSSTRFHDDFRADEWLLYDQHSPWAGNARGLARGSIFTHDGRLVCSVVQEGLVRPRR